MRTYSRKRRSQITPIKIFSDDETDHVPEMNKCHSPPAIVRTPPPPTHMERIKDDTLARSPARSDASSSMKSRESALERRVSLLLRSDSPTGFHGAGPSGSITPQPMFEPAPCALPVPPEEPEEEESMIEPGSKLQHERFGSIDPTNLFSSMTRKEQLRSPPSKPKANKLTKRMSTAIHMSMLAKASPKSPIGSSPAPSAKSNTSIRGSIGAGLKMLTRARSTVVRKTSPLIQSMSRKYRAKKKQGGSYENVSEQMVSGPTNDGLNEFANSPTSVFFDAPNAGDYAWAPTARTMVPSCPFASHPLPPHETAQRTASPLPTFPETLSPLLRQPTDISSDFDELSSRGTTRLRLAPSTKVNGSRRLRVTDATKPGLLDHVGRRSIDSTLSNAASSVGSQAPEHELRRTTTRIKRPALAVDSSGDRQSMTSLKRPRSTGKFLSLKRSHDDVFVDPPQPSSSIAASTAGTGNERGALREVDPNKKISYEDVGSVKIAKALRMSISPKVKEVFNKIPRRQRSSDRPVKTVEVRVSRSSSKASRILGHHFSSKEPLRPLTGNEITVSGVREESMSEDELAV